MTEHVWCHGPDCHKSHTVDRVRGTKGNKVLRTRKLPINPQWRENMYNYFCSNSCYNDFANKYIQQVIAIAPRTEALETPIEDPIKTTHVTSWGHTYTNTKIKEI